MTKSLAPLLLIASMTSLTIGASIAKNLFPVFGPGGTTFLRLALAAVLLGIYSRCWRARLDRRGWLLVAAYGAGLGFMNFFFYEAIARLPIGIAIAIEFLGPLSLSIFYSRTKYDFVWVALALAGIAMLVPHADAQRSLDARGVVYALIAAAAWAHYIVIGKKVGRVASSGTVTALGVAIGALVVAPFGGAAAMQVFARPDLMLAALGVGLLSSAIPYSLEMTALKHIDAKNFGILLSLEPAIGACAAFLFLGEGLRPLQVVAIACVITASIGSSLRLKGRRLKQNLPLAQ